MAGSTLATDSVTRVDIISSDGWRAEHWADSWELVVTDEGRTLKLFAKGDGDEAHDERNAALAEDLGWERIIEATEDR